MCYKNQTRFSMSHKFQKLMRSDKESRSTLAATWIGSAHLGWAGEKDIACIAEEALGTELTSQVELIELNEIKEFHAEMKMLATKRDSIRRTGRVERRRKRGNLKQSFFLSVFMGQRFTRQNKKALVYELSRWFCSGHRQIGLISF